MIHPVRIVAAVALLFLASDARATEILLLTPSGASVISLDASGNPSITTIGPFAAVIDLRGDANGGIVNPTPDVPAEPRPPADAPDAELAEKAARWADEESDPRGAAVAAMIYEQVADAVKSGELPPDRAANAARIAADKALWNWEGFRGKVGVAAAERLAAGSLLTAAEMSDFLRSVSIGVRSKAAEVELAFAIGVTREINAAIDAAKSE